MEKKQIRSITAIQKRHIKRENSGQLDTKRIQEDRQKRYAREVFRGEIRRAFVSGWKQGIQHGQNPKEIKQEEIGGSSAKESRKEKGSKEV